MGEEHRIVTMNPSEWEPDRGANPDDWVTIWFDLYEVEPWPDSETLQIQTQGHSWSYIVR